MAVYSILKVFFAAKLDELGNDDYDCLHQFDNSVPKKAKTDFFSNFSNSAKQNKILIL